MNCLSFSLQIKEVSASGQPVKRPNGEPANWPTHQPAYRPTITRHPANSSFRGLACIAGIPLRFRQDSFGIGPGRGKKRTGTGRERFDLTRPLPLRSLFVAPVLLPKDSSLKRTQAIRALHMLPGNRLKHSETIAKIAELTVLCLFWNHAHGGMHSAAMQCIVLLIVLLCFQVQLDWFTEPVAVVQLCRSKWPYVEVCRAISSHRTRKRALYTSRLLERFGWGAVTANNAIDAQFQEDCRVVLPSLADVCKTQTYLFKWSLYSAALTGTSSRATLWNWIAVANWPSEPWLIEQELSAVIVCTENKDPSNLFTFIHFFFSQYNLLERARKGTDTKTRRNRVRNFSDPLITLLIYCRRGTDKEHWGPLPCNIFIPTLPSLKIAIPNGQIKVQNQGLNTLISSFIVLLTNVQQSLFLHCTVPYSALNVVPVLLLQWNQVEVYKFELPPASTVR